MRIIYAQSRLQKDIILEALQNAPNGLTLNELRMIRNIRRSSIGTTIRKFAVAGIIYDSGTEYRGFEGRKVTVWKMK